MGQAYIFMFGFYFPFIIQCYTQRASNTILLNSVCLLTSLVMSCIEVLQVINKKGEYFKEFLNYFDVMLCVIYPVYFFYRIKERNVSKNMIPLATDEEHEIGWTIANNFIGIQGFIKFFSFLRVSKMFSKFTIMLVNVFLGLISFNLVFFSMIGLFAFLSSISGFVTFSEDDYPTDVNFVLATVTQTFRNSIGDINMPSIEAWKGTDYYIPMTFWAQALFFVSTYIMVIIMLNFLIAAISQSYDEVMGKEELYFAQSMADLNTESALVIDFLNKLKCFKMKPVQSFHI
jgi:hypothetical protein